MGSGIYGIGISALTTAQMALVSTDHNIANAHTPGYSRQRTIQSTNVSLYSGAGSFGQGVHVDTVQRQYDQYLTDQVNGAQARVGEVEGYYNQIKQIDNLLADPTAGLSPALQDFFTGVQSVVANPALLSSRQSMISTAEAMVTRFKTIDARLSELASEVNGKISDSVDMINSYTSQIGELNQQISLAEGAYGQPPNDLMDKRDNLVAELNKYIKVSVTIDPTGTYSLFVGSGQQLVLGSQVMQMSAVTSSADTEKIAVGLATAGGGKMELPDSLITGGQLGGLLKFRTESLDRATNELGRVAATMALTFNAQHALGQDLLGRANGDAGFNGNFFLMTDMQPGVKPYSTNNNGGTPVLTVNFVNPPAFGPERADGNYYTTLKTSDYNLTALAAPAGQYMLVRLSDNQQWTDTLANLSAMTQTNEGFSLNLAGADAVGNSYLIQPTRNAARNIGVNPTIAADPKNIAAALPFRTAATTTNTGAAKISAGTGVPGFDTVSNTTGFNTAWFPPGGVTLTYSSTAPASIAFTGIAAGQTIYYKDPNTVPATELSMVAPAVPPVSIPFSPGMTISVAGTSFSISGLPNNGDSFTVTRNTSATTDGRNGLSLGKLQSQNTTSGDPTLNKGAATMQTAYAEMVSANGTKTRELKTTFDAQSAVLAQAQKNRDATSGVNLDEEAANMIRFQQSYQAAAKIIEVGKSLFDTLLNIR